jgi:hypothetical protein
MISLKQKTPTESVGVCGVGRPIEGLGKKLQND